MRSASGRPEKGRALNTPGSFWFEGEFCRDEGCEAMLFSRPEALIRLTSPYGLPDFFMELEEWLARGCHLAGWIGYEAGEGFEPALSLPSCKPSSEGLLGWFAAYRSPERFSRHEVEAMLAKGAFEEGAFAVRDLAFEPGMDAYQAVIGRIHRAIGAGNVYQVNYTGRYRFSFEGDPLALYASLRKAQPAAFASFLASGEGHLLSLSPELFFRSRGSVIETMPMKGTAPRSASPERDAFGREALARSAKNCAENLMIVDLLRNDLGRICKSGSVHVPELFAIRSWPTLHQMVSLIRGELLEGIGLYELFRALFPCGSVTGAPKIRAMQLIRELEGGPRGAYTGTVGFITPEREMTFNVAIRTAWLAGGKGCYGAGSGIVWDSSAAEEYRECRLKGAILETLAEEERSGIFESLLWNGSWLWLREHLDRLEASASALAIPFLRSRAEAMLEATGRELCGRGSRFKVRLDLDPAGDLSLKSEAIAATDGTAVLRVCLAKARIDASNPLLSHKRAARAHYEAHLQAAREAGYDEVIFLNDRGEVAEGAISSVFVRREGRLLTPPLSAGILDGICRAAVLRTRPGAMEAVVHPGALQCGALFWLGNAVRGLRPARLAGILEFPQELPE